MEHILTYLKEKKDTVDVNLKTYLKNDEPLLEVLFESVNYTLFSGGKRIRPLFCFMVGEMFNVPEKKLMSLACSLEMIHTASLIMDDLPHMDNSDKRRGKAANHIIYGQDVASLATIGLLTRAYEIVLNDQLLTDNEKVMVVKNLANSVGLFGMVGGQFVDLKFSNESMPYSTLEFIHNHKTASLFVATGLSASILCGADKEQTEAIQLYAKHLGFAFQVLDDLINSFGDEEIVGKSLNLDKGNFAILYGKEKSHEVIVECTNKALEALKCFEGRNEKLVALSQILLSRKS